MMNLDNKYYGFHYSFDFYKLKDLRKQKEYSQEDVSRYCDVSINTISNIENGIFQPRLSLYLKLCECFDVPFEYMLQRCHYIRK